MEWPGQSACYLPQLSVRARPGLPACDFVFGVVIPFDSSTPRSLRSDVISTVWCPPPGPNGIGGAIPGSIGKDFRYTNLGHTHADRLLGTPKVSLAQLHFLILFS